MKEAIGTFNGWRCPTCKKLVGKPKHPFGIGKCKACGGELSFPIKRADVEKVTYHDPDFENYEKKVLELCSQDGAEIPVKVISYGDQGRPVVVNFLNRPLLLKSFEQYAKDKNLFLTEVVLGFAAMGFKFYREKTVLEKAMTPK